MDSVDETDLSIIRLLCRDCRIEQKKMAEKLKLHVNTIPLRIAKLEKRNIILGYTADIDYEKLGYEHTLLLLLRLRADVTRKDMEDIFAMPEVEGAGLITGEFQFVVMLRTKGYLEGRTAIGKICGRPQVLDSCVTRLMTKYKVPAQFNPFESQVHHFPKKEAPFALEAEDLKILKILQGDAKKSMNAIASELGVSVGVAKRRIEKMVDAGVIRGFTTRLNYAALGYSEYVLIGLQLAPEYFAKEDALVAKILEFPEVFTFCSSSGKYDFWLVMSFRDKAHMLDVLRKIGATPGLRAMEVNISYANYVGRYYPVL